MKKIVFASMIVQAMVLSVQADVTFSDVIIRQRQPWGTQIDVWFVMEGADAPCYVVPTVKLNGEPVSVAGSAVARDNFMQENGLGHLSIDLSQTSLAGQNVAGVSIELQTGDPMYRIYDLAYAQRLPDGSCPYTDVLASELHAGVYGSVATNPVSGIQSYVWTAVTNGTTYKYDKIVFRLVRPGTVHDDHENKDITVAEPYWGSVFEVTKTQYAFVTNKPSVWNESLPAVNISYLGMRGMQSEGINYPESGSQISATAGLNAFRTALGCNRVDLPTIAQWQYMARAGSTKPYFDNVSDTTVWPCGSNKYDEGLEPYLTTQFNYKVHTEDYTKKYVKNVGSYPPNAWGFYDVQGNAWEWVLEPAGTATAPKDPDRYRVSGMAQVVESRCRLGYFEAYSPLDAGVGNGLRIVMPVE